MDISLKLELNPKLNDEERELVSCVNDGQFHSVKITSNSMDIELDRKDSRFISGLRNVKLVFRVLDGGCLILRGHLQCSF